MGWGMAVPHLGAGAFVGVSPRPFENLGGDVSHTAQTAVCMHDKRTLCRFGVCLAVLDRARRSYDA